MDKLPMPPRRIAKTAPRFSDDEVNEVLHPTKTTILPVTVHTTTAVSKATAGVGTPVQLRLHDALLARLDKARGPDNRQTYIKRLLDTTLPR